MNHGFTLYTYVPLPTPLYPDITISRPVNPTINYNFLGFRALGLR